MSAILLPPALIAVVALILSLRLKTNQTMTCTHCELQFTKDVLLLQENALVQCRFCQKWMRSQNPEPILYSNLPMIQYPRKKTEHWKI
jgi:hypothetical protein